MKIEIPKKVKFIIDTIYERGYEAFIVGGCVRDSIVGIKPNDFDITTNAKPNDIKNIFRDYKIIDTGIKHGTVSVILDKDIYEITTYRIEGEYENNRKPKTVEFTANIYEDLKRRDFTINAMAYNDKVGLIDKFGGINDIKNKIIKTVGNPDERFEEDGLRIIRAIRFSSKLNFKIEDKTLDSIHKYAYILKNISLERITNEFDKILLSDNPKNIVLLYKTNILKAIGIDYDYSEDEYYIFEQKLNILKYCNDSLSNRLIMLKYLIINTGIKLKEYEKNENNANYLDILKEKTIVDVLRYPKKVINEVNKLTPYMFIEENLLDNIKIKYILKDIGYDNLLRILDLKRLYYKKTIREDCYNMHLNNILNRCEKEIDKIIKNEECYSISDLKIDGNKLKELGFRGLEIGLKLNLILDEVIKNPDLNKENELIEIAKKLYEPNGILK